MKNKFKILIILLLLISFSSCKKKPEPIETEKTLEEKIELLDDININLISKNSVKLSAFFVSNIISIVNPAISYPETEYNDLFKLEDYKTPQTNSEENEGNINAIKENNEPAKINLSTELMIRIRYTKDITNVPKKVLIKNIKINKKPNYGKLNFYAVVLGTEEDYLYKLRNNKINNEFEYKKDLTGKELKDGQLDLRFSSLIDNILLTDTKTLRSTNYKNLLSNKNITLDSLKYNISFDIIIYSENNIYVLPFTYEFGDIDLSSDNMYKIYNYKDPLYFYVIE